MEINKLILGLDIDSRVSLELLWKVAEHNGIEPKQVASLMQTQEMEKDLSIRRQLNSKKVL